MELQDKEKAYEHNIWEIYRREWATASPKKRIELNKRMLRWQELVKSGWTPSQAHYRVMEEYSSKPTNKPFWSRMGKSAAVISALALVAAIVYSVVIAGEIGTLKTELESAQGFLTSTQTELSSMEQTFVSTQTELSSTKQTLASTQTELSSTQSELTSTTQTLTIAQTEINSLNDTLASVQNELDTTRAQLETAEAKIRLYEETMGVEVFFSVQPPYEKESTGRPLAISLSTNTTATDPAWQELIAFLLADLTDDELYQLNIFDCANFAEMLHNNAEAAGIKAAFVAVHFSDQKQGHALNAFKTTDRGLVYVDCTGPTLTQWLQQPYLEWDKIAYVAKEKEYGSVSISLTVYPEYSYYEQIGKSSGSGWAPLGIVENIEIYW